MSHSHCKKTSQKCNDKHCNKHCDKHCDKHCNKCSEKCGEKHHSKCDSLFDKECITKNNIGALKTKFGFDIIPFTDEVQNAGYTLDDTENAGVWYGPVSDGRYFWYSAFRYNFLSPFLPSILVCRKVSNGKLVYAKNCNDYNMDTSQNAANIIVRISPVVSEDRLYMTSSSATNTGPQLYAINKLTGQLIWSYAYYPPSPLLPTTIRTDYSAFANSNVRLGDTCPIIIKNNYIVIGASSVQNTPFNIGVRTGNFPMYTDQGKVFIIKDNGSSPSQYLDWTSCPPILNVGEPITSDSFLPGFDYTVIGTVSIDHPKDMYIFGSDPNVPVPPSPAFPNSSPIAAIYNGGSTTFNQTIWNYVDKIYVNTDRVNGYSPIDVFNHLNTGTNYIWAYLDETLINQVMSENGNDGLYFYKKMTTGLIENNHDAHGLNYYGNGNWGPHITFSDDKLFFGTGQTHHMPFLEQYLYDNDSNSFLNKKIPVAFASNDYVSNPTSQNLANLNDAKDDFTHTMRTNQLDRSPRGHKNYSDSIVCIDFNDGFKFGIRHIPHDIYTFLSLDPNYVLVGDVTKPTNVSDGDVSSGIRIFDKLARKKIATITKTGLGVVIDIEDINNPIYSLCRYIGPHSTLGGSNYKCAQDKSNIYCCQPNINTLGNPFPNNPLYIERMVTKDGEYIPIGTSFLTCFDVNDGIIRWNTKLTSLAFSQAGSVNGAVLSLDLIGNLYAHNMKNGKLLWRLDNSNTKYASHGGIAEPCVLCDKIIWCPNYRIPQPLPPYPPNTSPGANGKYGLILTLDKCNIIKNKKCLCDYVDHVFESHINNNIVIRQKWCKCNKILVKINNENHTIHIDEHGKIINPSIFSNLVVINKILYQMNYSYDGESADLLFTRI